MCRWRSRRRRKEWPHGKVAARRDTRAGQRRIPRREEKTIPRARWIVSATLPATFRARIQANDRSGNHRAPTIRFAAKARAIRSVQKIRRHTRSQKNAMVQDGALPKRGGERLKI